MTTFKFKTSIVALVAAAIMFIIACHKDNSIQETRVSPMALFSPTETGDAEEASAIIQQFGGSEVPNIVEIIVDDILIGVVPGAEVTLNGHVYLTDESGRVRIEDATILENFAYVKVRKEGYFDGSRTFAAVDVEHGGTVSIAIRLFPLGDPITVVAGSPSIVNVPTPYGEAHIDLSGEYLDEDGNPYAGNVLVYAKYLDPLSPETNATMPGALLGINTQNEMVSLISYGMLNVQLIGDAGQQLQIGSPATLRTPIHPDQLATAPDDIPMWYFNETAGVWIEEGVGSRDGGDYVAVVSHFTTWNYDISNPPVTLYFKVVDQLGNDLSGALVDITSTPFTSACNYYGPGWESNYIPENTACSLMASWGSYTSSVTNFTSPSSTSSTPYVYQLLVINVPIAHTISGNLLKCGGLPVSGTVTITELPSGPTVTISTVGIGGYSHTIMSTTPPTISIFGTNSGSNSSTTILILNPGANIHDISFCERIEYSINGGPQHKDALSPWGEELTPTDMFVVAFDGSNPLAKTRIVSHTLTPGLGYSYGSAPGEMEFTDFSDPAGMSPIGNGITFDLVQYPPVVGGMIEINFHGTYDDNFGTTKSIIGKAYIKRKF